MKSCIMCGALHEVLLSDGTCSRSCKATLLNAKRYRFTRIHFCESCRKPFKHRLRGGNNGRSPGRNNSCGCKTDSNRFCSKECAYISKTSFVDTNWAELKEVECVQCGKSIVQTGNNSRKYCSRKCSSKAYAVKTDNVDRVTKRRCPHCGKTFVPVMGDRRVKYCSVECFNKSYTKRANLKQRLVKTGLMYNHIHPVDVYERDKWICALCGLIVDKSLFGTKHPMGPSLDHVIPVSKGGKHTLDNLQLAHISCNGKKTDTLPGRGSLG